MVISFFEINELEQKRFEEKLQGNTLKFFEESIQNVDKNFYHQIYKTPIVYKLMLLCK